MSRESAENVVRVLQEAGHEAVFAGGCVRDRLLAIEPADHDVATSAIPEQIEALKPAQGRAREGVSACHKE